MDSRKLDKGRYKVQINIMIPLQWREKLEDLARLESVKRKANITCQDLIRDILDEKLKLSEKKKAGRSK